MTFVLVDVVDVIQNRATIQVERSKGKLFIGKKSTFFLRNHLNKRPELGQYTSNHFETFSEIGGCVDI